MYGGVVSERPIWWAGVDSEVLYPTVLTLKPKKLKCFPLSIHFYYFSYALWGLSFKVFSLNFRCRDSLYDHEHFSVIGKVGNYL